MMGAGLIGLWLLAWAGNAWLANQRFAWVRYLVPALFGATLVLIWQLAVQGFAISPAILPPPSAIYARAMGSLPVLWGDFVQTFVRGALSGYVIGCLAAVIVAVLIDRSAFLQAGLLPIGNFAAALPIVGVAPIMVMWFGFDWQSKAAVVVIMVFFPMLVNTMAGLRASEAMQRDLMATYSAGYWVSMRKLRLPAALPFMFNGLKICSTLAPIGAIVAEFFGSPTQGMGFRINAEIGRTGLDMIWATIAVAALAGSGFYGLVALIEKRMTFWHPSQRG